MRRMAAVVLVAAAVTGAGALSAMAAGPPASLAGSLTANGRVLWNLDALLNDTFGNRTDCYDAKETAIFAVGRGGSCPAPEARYQTYVFTFLNAFGSQFRLVALSKPPFTGVTNVPSRSLPVTAARPASVAQASSEPAGSPRPIDR